MQTIETRTDNSRRLIMRAINLLEKRYGTRKTFRRRPVENFLLNDQHQHPERQLLRKLQCRWPVI